MVGELIDLEHYTIQLETLSLHSTCGWALVIAVPSVHLRIIILTILLCVQKSEESVL
jgi:hypothetical protein